MKKDLSCGYVLGMSVFLFFVASGVGALGGVAISSVTKNDYHCVEWTVLICDAILIPFYLFPFLEVELKSIHSYSKRSITIIIKSYKIQE